MGYKILAGRRVVQASLSSAKTKPRVAIKETRDRAPGFPWPAQVLMTLIEGGLTSASTIWRVIISKGLCKNPA